MHRPISDWGGNIAAFILVIAVNGMANGVPLGGQTTGEISAKYPSLFTPAGFIFGIWGLIYLGLLAFVVYQALPAQRDNDTLARISGPFKLNCLANATWIFAWHYDLLWMSLLLMFAILVTLVRIYRINAADLSDASFAEWLLIVFPFSIYTGWITVATIANISAVQTGMGWDDAGMAAVDWTWVKLALAGAIGAIVIARRRDAIYVLVIAWAAFGIYSKQAATPEVAGAAITLSLLALLLAGYALARRLTGLNRLGF